MPKSGASNFHNNKVDSEKSSESLWNILLIINSFYLNTSYKVLKINNSISFLKTGYLTLAAEYRKFLTTSPMFSLFFEQIYVLYLKF